MAQTVQDTEAVLALLLRCIEDGLADDVLAEAMERCRRKQSQMKGETV